MEYHPYLKSPGRHFPRTHWAPHWEIVLTHDHPDAQSAGEYGRAWFINRHLHPGPAFDWAARVTRDTPGIDEDPLGCHVSAAALPPGCEGSLADDIFAPQWPADDLRTGKIHRDGDGRTAHQRDWDFLREAAAQACADAGLDANAPVEARVHAFAALQNQHKHTPVYPSRHPVDTLLHSSYCTGVSNLFAALCLVSDIPVRTINDYGHSMAEFWDGHSWRFVDNLTAGQRESYATKPGSPAPCVFNRNYVQMLLDPRAPDGAPLSAEHAARYAVDRNCFEPYLNTATRDWRFDHGRIGLGPGLSPLAGGYGLFALPCPDNLRAIYPGWDEPLCPARAGRENELVLNPRQGWLESVVRLDRGLGIRKSFYVGRLDDGANPVCSARADLHLHDGIGSEFKPARAGWTLLLNGRELPLDAARFTQHTGLLTFHLPLDGLRENAMNRLELCSERAYTGPLRYAMPDTLAVKIHPDPLGGGEPWYADAAAGRYRMKWETAGDDASVYDMHSAWLMVPRGI